MYFKCFRFYIFAMLLICFKCALAEPPSAMLEKSANDLLVQLANNNARVKADKGYVNQLVYKYIIPRVDTYGMSRSALGRDAWRQASSSQRQKFTQNFTSLVVRTYSSALRGYSGEKVIFSPIRGGYQGKRFVKVSSIIIRTNGQNIPISYSLVNHKGNWKIYDMSVEGVSILQSYRSQFSQYLQSNSLEQLIATLKTRRFKGHKV